MALVIYDEMKKAQLKPNSVTYNSLIDTCVRSGRLPLAWEFLEEMQKEGICPDNFTYSTLIKGIKGQENVKDLERAF